MSSARRRRQQHSEDLPEGDARLPATPTRLGRVTKVPDAGVGGSPAEGDGGRAATGRRTTRRSPRNLAASGVAAAQLAEVTPTDHRTPHQSESRDGSTVEAERPMQQQEQQRRQGWGGGTEQASQAELSGSSTEWVLEGRVSGAEDVFGRAGQLTGLFALGVGPSSLLLCEEAVPEVPIGVEGHASAGSVGARALDAVDVHDEEELLQLVEAGGTALGFSQRELRSAAPALLPSVPDGGHRQTEGLGRGPEAAITISDDESDGDGDIVVLPGTVVPGNVPMPSPGQGPHAAGHQGGILNLPSPALGVNLAPGRARDSRAPSAPCSRNDDDVEVIFESKAPAKRRRQMRLASARPQSEGPSTQIFIILDSPEAAQAAEQRQHLQHPLSRAPSLHTQQQQHQHQQQEQQQHQHPFGFSDPSRTQNAAPGPDMGLRLGASGLNFHRAGGGPHALQSSGDYRPTLPIFGGPAPFNSEALAPGIDPPGFPERRACSKSLHAPSSDSDNESPPGEAGPGHMTCPICLDVMKEHTTTTCGHLFCWSCIKLAVQNKKCCPTCRRKLGKSSFHRIYLGT